MNDAVKPPIPTDVWYDPETDRFASCVGDDLPPTFWFTWRDRKNEFPTSFNEGHRIWEASRAKPSIKPPIPNNVWYANDEFFINADSFSDAYRNFCTGYREFYNQWIGRKDDFPTSEFNTPGPGHKPPIPAEVWYRAITDEFIHLNDGDLPLGFYEQWLERKNEFPASEWQCRELKNAASKAKPPIPLGVWYDHDWDVFFSLGAEHQLSNAFYTAWCSRAEEFPASESYAFSLQASLPPIPKGILYDAENDVFIIPAYVQVDASHSAFYADYPAFCETWKARKYEFPAFECEIPNGSIKSKPSIQGKGLTQSTEPDISMKQPYLLIAMIQVMVLGNKTTVPWTAIVLATSPETADAAVQRHAAATGRKVMTYTVGVVDVITD